MNDTTTAALAAEYLELKAKTAELDDRIKQIVALLRELGEGRHEAGTATVTVGATPHRFSAARASEVLATNPALLEQCQELVVSSTKAREILPPAVYALCSLPVGEARVSVRV